MNYEKLGEKLVVLQEHRPDLYKRVREEQLSINGAFHLARKGLGKHCYIYFIQAELGGPIKVGCSFDPERRLRQLQLLCPFKLKLLGRLIGSRADEKKMHEAMRKHHAWGEWFHPSRYLMGMVEMAAANMIDAADELAAGQ
jgi:hypothetical protein